MRKTNCERLIIELLKRKHL